MITEGIHIGEVVDHRIRISAGKGTWAVEVTFKVGEDLIPASIWLTDKAMGLARKGLKAIGWDMDKPEANLEELNDNPTLLAGNRAELDIAPETWKGRTTMKVQWVNPINRPPTGDEAARILKGLREVKQPVEPDTPPRPEPGEDIPF